MVFDWNMVVYLLGLAAMAGSIWTKLSMLEKKVGKHNNFIERLTKVEENEKELCRCIDKIEKRLENLL